MHRYFIQVFGRVQGVGFRYFVNYTANDFNLTGWVKNSEDGSVHMEVQGKEQAISLFIEKVKKGNLFVKVEDMYCEKVEVVNTERSFKIVY